MANTTRTVKVKFDGNARGLVRAAKRGENAMADFQRQANRSMDLDFASGLLDALGALPAQLKGAAIIAGAGIGVAMAPALASALISGVLLAVGGGVLAAGIIGAAKSPKVVNAWKKFADQAGKTFERFSAPFVKPLVQAAGTFTAALKRADPIIQAIGRTMAPIIDKLAPAFASMAEKMLPGILAAAQASVPLFQVLADNLPGIGLAVSQFFQAIAAGGPGAVTFFSGFLGWVQDILPKLGGVVTWVSNLGTKIDGLKERLAPLRDALETVGTFIKDGMAEARKIFGEWLSQNREKIDKFITQLSGFVADTGPAFRLAIIGIAFAFVTFAQNVMLLVDALDRLKRWWHDNKSWLLNFSPLLGAISSKEGGIPGIGARAKGGNVEANHDYLVGEEGPEILRMGSRSGTIIPNHEIGTGGGGWPPIIVENHIEIGGEVVRVVRTEIREHDRGLKRGVLAGAGAR